jgi:hypothetical protein
MLLPKAERDPRATRQKHLHCAAFPSSPTAVARLTSLVSLPRTALVNRNFNPLVAYVFRLFPSYLTDSNPSPTGPCLDCFVRTSPNGQSCLK